MQLSLNKPRCAVHLQLPGMLQQVGALSEDGGVTQLQGSFQASRVVAKPDAQPACHQSISLAQVQICTAALTAAGTSGPARTKTHAACAAADLELHACIVPQSMGADVSAMRHRAVPGQRLVGCSLRSSRHALGAQHGGVQLLCPRIVPCCLQHLRIGSISDTQVESCPGSAARRRIASLPLHSPLLPPAPAHQCISQANDEWVHLLEGRLTGGRAGHCPQRPAERLWQQPARLLATCC